MRAMTLRPLLCSVMVAEMLNAIQGQRLAFLPWDGFQSRQTLLSYDGPRLELLRTYGGQNVLRWWLDADSNTTRRVYLPISEGRLVEVLGGVLPARSALEQPEDGYVYVVDEDNQTGQDKQIIQTTGDALDRDALPIPEVRLDVTIPTDLLRVPSNPRAHQLITRLMPSDRNAVYVPTRVAGLYLSAVQRLIDSLGQAVDGHPSMRGPISADLLAKTRLNTVAAYPASLTLYLESDKGDDLFNSSLVRSSLESLFRLLEAGSAEGKLFQELRVLRGRVAKNYDDLLAIIALSAASASLSWHEHGLHLARQATVTAETAVGIREVITGMRSSLQERLTLRATLISGSLRTLRFEIDDQSGERISGFVDDEARDQMKIRLGGLCDVTLEPQIDVSVATGEERTTYILKSIRPVETPQI